MAKELGSRFIRANVVAPGAVATDFNGARLRSNAHAQEAIKNVTALPRIAQADDIGSVVAFSALTKPNGSTASALKCLAVWRCNSRFQNSKSPNP